jgi:hypothetical protein
MTGYTTKQTKTPLEQLENQTLRDAAWSPASQTSSQVPKTSACHAIMGTFSFFAI